MAKDKIVVKDGKGNKRVVQRSMVPEGFTYVEDYNAPKKAKSATENTNKTTTKKNTKKTETKSSDKK